MIATMIAAALLVATPQAEHPLVRQAITDCPLNRRPSEAQQAMVEELFRIELDAGVPDVARGLLAAAACRESAYRKRPGCGDAGRSCGVFQFGGWAIRHLKARGAQGDDPRLDWRVAARYWLHRVKRSMRLVKRDCRGRGGYASREAYLWASANKTATWRPKCRRKHCKGGRCFCSSLAGRCSVPPWRSRGVRMETKHWRLVRRWRSATQVQESPRERSKDKRDPTAARDDERPQGRAQAQPRRS